MSKISNAITMLNLLSTGKKYSIIELSNILEVSPRMIRTYKEELEKCGIYIDSIMGPNGGYVLNQSIRIPSRKFAKKDYELLNKYIENSDSIEEKEKLENLKDKIRGIYIGSKSEEKELNLNNEILTKYNVLTRAIKSRRKVKILYYSFGKGETERIIYPAFNSLINSKNNHNFNVFCAFNNEEIGSLTEQGADSEFLMDILTRIAHATDVDLLPALRNSFVVSADNAHALHPNASSKNDPTNKVYLNQGIVIKNNTNYTTDAVTSSLFKGICEDAKVPYQHYACRTDMRCGSTLGGLSQRHVSVDSIDIGLPQLAMHSANETMGSEDLQHLYNALVEFYNTSFIREKDKILIKK